jgi:hypothetical protein
VHGVLLAFPSGFPQVKLHGLPTLQLFIAKLNK